MRSYLFFNVRKFRLKIKTGLQPINLIYSYILLFKSLWSVRFCFKEINKFIQQEHIKFIKSDSKDFEIVTKKSIFHIKCGPF